MNNLRLTYLKGSKECGLSFGTNFDGRMWNVESPKLDGYTYDRGCVPTFMLGGLVKHKLVPAKYAHDSI